MGNALTMSAKPITGFCRYTWQGASCNALGLTSKQVTKSNLPSPKGSLSFVPPKTLFVIEYRAVLVLTHAQPSARRYPACRPLKNPRTPSITRSTSPSIKNACMGRLRSREQSKSAFGQRTAPNSSKAFCR